MAGEPRAPGGARPRALRGGGPRRGLAARLGAAAREPLGRPRPGPGRRGERRLAAARGGPISFVCSFDCFSAAFSIAFRSSEAAVTDREVRPDLSVAGIWWSDGAVGVFSLTRVGDAARLPLPCAAAFALDRVQVGGMAQGAGVAALRGRGGNVCTLDDAVVCAIPALDAAPVLDVVGEYEHSRGGRVVVHPDRRVDNPYARQTSELQVGRSFVEYLGHPGRVLADRIEFTNGSSWVKQRAGLPFVRSAYSNGTRNGGVAPAGPLGSRAGLPGEGSLRAA